MPVPNLEQACLPTVLLLGEPCRPGEMEAAFPRHRVMVAPREALEGTSPLLEELWGGSVRLDTLVVREEIAVPEIAAFLVHEAVVLVDARHARGEAWDDFLSAPWLRERQVCLQLLGPGEGLEPSSPMP